MFNQRDGPSLQPQGSNSRLPVNQNYSLSPNRPAPMNFNQGGNNQFNRNQSQGRFVVPSYQAPIGHLPANTMANLKGRNVRFEPRDQIPVRVQRNDQPIQPQVSPNFQGGTVMQNQGSAQNLNQNKNPPNPFNFINQSPSRDSINISNKPSNTVSMP